MAVTAAPLIQSPWFTILTNPRLRSSRRTCAPIGNSVRRRRRLCLSFSELLISSSVKRPRNAARLGGRADNRDAVDEAKPRVAASATLGSAKQGVETLTGLGSITNLVYPT